MFLLSMQLVVALAAAPEVHPHAAKVELRVSPRITTADLVDGRLITATLIIRNADESLWCPEVDWDWNGQHSSQTSDCVPYSESEVGERELWIQTKQRRFFGRGIVNIIVRILRGGKVIRRVEAQVPVQ